MSYLDGELRGSSGVPYIACRDDVNSKAESNAVYGGDHGLRASFNCRDRILEFLRGVGRERICWRKGSPLANSILKVN